MNSAWLGLIIPLWCVLLMVGYCGILYAIIDSGEDTGIAPRLIGFYKGSLIGIAGSSTGANPLFLLAVAAIPLTCLGFSLGYFQRHVREPGLKGFAHVLGALNLLLIWGLIKWLTSTKAV
ncbi:hypothetical protein ACF3NA_10175 [Alkanindiges sp. WGS2144]|uniref:hypothetical protein n=1 Tax=Alkanindiges sp. WGS2144 TaxID=3366808 RepID=UPI00375306F2